MSSPEVLPKHLVTSSSYETESDDDEFPTIKTYDEDNSIAKLPGTALLRSVHKKPKNQSNHESVKSIQSDHTYDFDKKSSGDGYENEDEFGEDLDGSPIPTTKKQLENSNCSDARVPAWKLRQQALRSDVPPPPKTIIGNENGNESDKPSPLRKVRKTRSGSYNNQDSAGQSWLKKLTTKKETPDEKEKRIKSEALIKKQVSSRWGKDILEEDEDDDEQGNNAIEPTIEEDTELEKEEDESDTVKKVKSVIEKSFGSALVFTIKKDKEAANEDDSAPKSLTKKAGRGNRWAMMGSAAMKSMRNVQKGLMRGEEIEKTKNENIEEGEDEEESDNTAESQPDDIRRSVMWTNRGAAAFTSVRNAWGGDARRKELFDGDESSTHDDGLDSKSHHSDLSRLDIDSSSKRNKEQNRNLLSSIGNFLQHTRARFDPEVWSDPEIQETIAAIEKLRTKLNDNRIEHKNGTRRRERQIENSITQQKTFLARKLARQMYGYRSNPFHPCIKEIYEKEILIIVHEVTSLGCDDDSQIEKDGIDAMLDSQNFDFDSEEEDANENEANDTLGVFFSKNTEKSGEKKRGDNTSVDDSLFSVDGSTIHVGGNSVVPLQTRLIRAQHNKWILLKQMELARSFQQKYIEHLYDVIPEIQKEHEKLKAVPQSALEAKTKEMEMFNSKLKESYEAHVDAQEKLLTIYRERYVPSVHENEDDDGNEEKNESSDEEEDVFNSFQSSPVKGVPKRPGMWAKNLSQSVRGLFGPKKDENEETNVGDDDSVGNISQGSKGGFNLPSPIPDGSQSKKKFLLSFGSPDGSKAASGILANFVSPAPLSQEDDEATDKQSQQDSAKDSAAAAWTVPKMDKASLPETLAEKRAKRAAVRRANRPDAPSASGSASGSSCRKTTTSTTVKASASRSELLQRARKARQESTAALGTLSKQPSSPTPSSRSGRSSLRSNTASIRKELSMKDVMAAAGDSRRKLMESDSRMERLAHKKNQLSKTSPLNSATGVSVSVPFSRAGSRLSEEQRLRVVMGLKQDADLNMSSHHSLHERKPRSRSLKLATGFGDGDEGEDPVHDSSLHDVDEFDG